MDLLQKHTRTVERVNQRKLFTKSLRTTQKGFLTPLAQDIFAPDTIIAGSFRIISIIGEGGSSVVYLVRHTTLSNQYALKVLSPDQLTERSWLRFQAEAKILSSLTHPTFVKVYDLGVHEQKFPFYSMDYLQGRTLEELLVSQGSMGLEAVIKIFLEVLDGLAYAHRNKIIHRDLKPDNIMLCTTDGVQTVKILDFGISKFEGSNSQQKLTLAGDVFGSPSYMSPEQCAGEPADARSDIYSIGCSLFEALTGFVPFEGATAVDTALLHQEQTAPTLSAVSGQVFPRTIEYVVSKCLKKNPSERYQLVKELALDLTRIQEGKDPLEYLAGGISTTSPVTQSKSTNTGLKGFWLPAGFLLALLTVSLAASALVLYLVKNYQNKTTPPLVSTASTVTAPAKTVLSGDDTEIQTPAGSQNETKKYSTIGVIGNQSYRCFYFPEDTLIGTIGLRQQPNNKQDARGFIRYKQNDQLEFSPTAMAAKFPKYLTRFQNGDISTIRLLSSQSNDKMLAAVAQIPQVEALRFLSDDGLTPGSIASLNKFQNLRDFDAFAISLNGNVLAKATCWKRLQRFYWTGAIAPSAMLATLKGNPNLKTLGLKNSSLNHSDFKAIARLTPLIMLQISGNTLTPKDLEVLAQLPNLQYLYAERCGLDQNCQALKKFKKLKQLHISKAEQIESFAEP